MSVFSKVAICIVACANMADGKMFLADAVAKGTGADKVVEGAGKLASGDIEGAAKTGINAAADKACPGAAQAVGAATAVANGENVGDAAVSAATEKKNLVEED